MISSTIILNSTDLIRIVAEENGIDFALIEKDYWIMHCLYGLQQLGYTSELKGGTSLSKGASDHQPFFGGMDADRASG